MNQEELIHIIVATLVISFSFAVAFTGMAFDSGFLLMFGIVLVTVGIGFIAHELAHKYVAQHYGALAAFRLWPIGLAIALVSSLMGFVFAAPGAVYIFGPHINRKQNGKISLAGPAVNLVLAIVFLLVFLSVPLVFSLTKDVALVSMVAFIGVLGMKINSWLGLFNMIPFFPFDGEKIFKWSAAVWILMAGSLAFINFVLPMFLPAFQVG